jgi:hypothetical protein
VKENGEWVHKAWEESNHDPVLIMHISGSTSKTSNLIPIKPMKQSRKGTLISRAIIEEYAEEIDALYQRTFQVSDEVNSNFTRKTLLKIGSCTSRATSLSRQFDQV